MKAKRKLNRNTQPTKNYRQGDKVVVIAGDDKGLVGEIMKMLGEQVVVRGANVCKKHVKKSQEHPQGGVAEFEKPIHVSNVMHAVGEDTGVKIRKRYNAEGEKELFYKKDGKEITYRLVKKGSGNV